MSTITAAQARRALEEADLIFTPGQIEEALDAMAEAISARLGDCDPLLLPVMHGGLVPAGQLLPRLRFPLRVDYIHATRYRERTYGTDLQWVRHPTEPLAGRHVLLIDDILDEGYTLAALIDWCRSQGATEVLTAVLVYKTHGRGAGLKADFAGLAAPDRYLFGYGMDYGGYWRNAPGIYALAESTAQEKS